MLEPHLAVPDVRRVNVRGRQLAVQIRGTGPTVVMEMGGGFGGIGPHWCVDGELARFCRVLVYDRAGLGGSDRIQGHPTMGERAHDLAALLDAVDIREPALFVGWSLGGLILQNFAARNPARVGGLLLIDPTPPDFLEHLGTLGRCAFSAAIATMNRIQLLLALTGFLKTRAGRNMLRKLIGPSWGPHMPSAYAERMVKALAQPALHRAMILEADRMLDACRETLQLMTERGMPRVPSILLAATHRPGSPEKMRTGLHNRLLELMPEMQLRELPETGHLIPPEAPESVLQAVRDLLVRRGADCHSAAAGESDRATTTVSSFTTTKARQ
jgi:pimeloyl-ACP methyl ester carboxylesterase